MKQPCSCLPDKRTINLKLALIQDLIFCERIIVFEIFVRMENTANSHVRGKREF